MHLGSEVEALDLELREYHFFLLPAAVPLRVVAVETAECVEALSVIVLVELLVEEALDRLSSFSLIRSLSAVVQSSGSSGRTRSLPEGVWAI